MSSSISPTRDARSSRGWADLLAIMTGLALIALSIWPSGATAGDDAELQLGQPDIAYVVRIAAGIMAVFAVFIAQRWRNRNTGRVLLIAAAIALVALLAASRDFGARSLFQTLVPAALLGLAATAVGPLPADPGRPRAR